MKKFLLAGLGALASGCVTIDRDTAPPTQLPEVRPGYVAGYLQPDQLPDSVLLLGAPPAAGSAAFAADEEFHRATRKLRDTPRWTQAIKDAELRFPQAAQVFSCALDLPISEQATPHLNMLLRRVRMDSSRANDRAKSQYKRPRPFMVTGETPCSKEQSSPDSYPSGHASIGWAWALVLAEIAPEQANQILLRGLEFGSSRVVCGVHWRSDIEAGRTVGASTVSRLHGDPVFTAQMAFARREIVAARAAGARSPNDCIAEKRAFTSTQ